MRSTRAVRRGVAAGEVGGDPFADRARLADVEQLAVAAVEEVDAGRVGQRRGAAAAIRSARVERAAVRLPFGHRSKGRLLATRPNSDAKTEREMTSETLSPPELNTLRIEIDGEIGTLTLDRPDAFNAMSPEMIGELTVAFAWLADQAPLRGADRHRRRQGLLRRRRRHLVPQRGRGRRDRPALRRAPRGRGPAPGDRRPAADPLPGDRRGQRPGGRRRLLAGARLRHPDRLRARLLRLRLRPHRRLARRRHDLLPAPRRRPEQGAGTAARGPQPDRRRRARGAGLVARGRRRRTS